MRWPTASLRKIAPPLAVPCTFSPDERVWQLSLDQIESGTGVIIDKRYAAASDAGPSTFCFDTGNVLYSKLRPYLNKVALPDEPGIATTELIPLRPDPLTLNPRFLAYYLRSPAFVNQASHHVAGAKMPRVVMDWFWEHQAPLPAPREQTRIVELLDDGDHLRRLRRGADLKATRILPALFVKMFGDPATNPMRWDEKPLRSVIATVEAGWSTPGEPRLRNEHEFGVLKVSAVTSGRFLPEEHKAVSESLDARALVTPRRGDLLFSRANTRELVAASCIVEADQPKLFLSDKLWKLCPHEQLASSLFLKELFSQTYVRDKFRISSSGSSGSMLNISQDALLRTVVPIPPYPLQMEFERVAWATMEMLERARRATAQLEATWEVMLQWAFSGQLTARWRESRAQELRAEMELQAHSLSLSIPKELEMSS